MKEKLMSKGEKKDLEMRKEYEFKGGIRGKYASKFAESSNVVVLSEDVAEIFPDSESVNNALKPMADLIRKRLKKEKTAS